METFLFTIGAMLLLNKKQSNISGVNGTTGRVYEYFTTQRKITDLEKRANVLKADASKVLVKVKDSKNLSAPEKDMLRKDIMQAVNL